MRLQESSFTKLTAT